jgi:nucleoside-diphosphate-sugar epimerase
MGCSYASIKELAMRVFVAGATGAIGRQLVPRLVAAGHEVHGMTRSESKQAMLVEMGAVPVVADALDPDQVAEAVGRARPDVIVHQLTAIPETLHMRHFDRDFALTNRLRTEGTDHLLSAGQAVGVRRFVAQSYFAQYARSGAAVKSEEDPIDRAPARQMREVLAAIRHLEAAVLDARWTEGIVLRYGALYGPGTSLAAGGDQAELVRRHKFNEVEFATIMHFESLDAVIAFAGDEYETAYVPPRARAVLRRYDERSAHFEVLLRPPTD